VPGARFDGTSRTYSDARVGDLIGPVSYGPLTVMHLVRWGAALENWHRIHYDCEFCTAHEGLPGPLINGSWKQQVLAQLLKEWAGPAGWLLALTFEFRGMDVVGETLTASGRVISGEDFGDYGDVLCSIELTNSAGNSTTVGEALVRLPTEPQTAVAYPVDPENGGSFSLAPSAGDKPLGSRYADYIGVTSDRLVSTDAVDASSIRRFMQAILARDPDCYDDSGSGARRFGTIVAPPLFPLYPLRVPPTQADPLERASADPDFDGASQTPWVSFGLPELPGAPERILNGGNSVDLFAYAPLGSHIAVQSSYADIYEKPGKAGPLLFVSVVSEYSVHETGRLLVRSRQTTILR
jgi:acyl dehydratase